jgi:hypothetical protein
MRLFFALSAAMGFVVMGEDCTNAYVSGCVCQLLEFSAGVYSSTHGGTGNTWRRHIRGANLRRQQARTEYGSPERDSQTYLDLEVQEVWPWQGKVHLAGRVGLDERSVEDRERRSYLHRSERVPFSGGSGASFIPSS